MASVSGERLADGKTSADAREQMPVKRLEKVGRDNAMFAIQNIQDALISQDRAEEALLRLNEASSIRAPRIIQGRDDRGERPAERERLSEALNLEAGRDIVEGVESFEFAMGPAVCRCGASRFWPAGRVEDVSVPISVPAINKSA
jgi:hypothetical protein